MSLAPGRKHDMAMLEARLATAKTYDQWVNARLKMDALIEEGKDKQLHSLRWQLVQASRAGDTKAGERISLEIYEHQRRQGKYKHIKDSNERDD